MRDTGSTAGRPDMAVIGIDLEVNEGEVVALLGSNGAGKTTTLRAISGMIKPMSGDITFDGRHIGGMAAEKIARAGLIHVPQGRGIFPSLGVEESLRLAAAMAKVPRGEVQAGDIGPGTVVRVQLRIVRATARPPQVWNAVAILVQPGLKP